MSSTETFNQIFSLLTLTVNVFLIIIILALTFKKSILDKSFFVFFKKYSYQFITGLAWAGVVGSLIYSEVINYAPCNLCWWQRIFLYPIAILTTFALFKKEKTIDSYILSLAIPGGLIALYHSILQVSSSMNPFLCTGGEEDCANVYFLQFGFVTLPFMAFSVFALIAVLVIMSKMFPKIDK